MFAFARRTAVVALVARRLGVWAVVLAATAVATRPATAQFIWNNPAGGNWSTTNPSPNWTGGVPTPGTTTTLTFGEPGTRTATYTATNDLGTFDLNSLTVNNTSGTVTVAGNALNFTGSGPKVVVEGAGSMIVSAPVNLSANLSVQGSGTGGFTFGGALGGGTNSIVKTSAGTLTFSGGGTLSQLNVQTGSAAVTGGTLALTLPDALGIAAGLPIGSLGQTASATVSGGATVNVTDNTFVGDAPGSTGTLTVTGPGTVYNNGSPATGSTTTSMSGRLAVGNEGTGTLNVLAGGVVNTDRLFSSRQAGSSSTVLVDGTGSTLHALTQASIGNQGNGTLTVQAGGKVQADTSINLGNVGASQTGTITVTGSGSALSVGTSTVAGLLTIGSAANTTGTVTVTGTGATLSVGTATAAGQLTIGSAANTTSNFNVLAGGTATVTGNLFAAINSPSTATITIDGANSLLSVSGQYSNSGGGGAGVNAGTVTLNVTGGGRVQVGGNAFLGQNPGGGVTATVGGANSTFAVTGALGLLNGTNGLTVQSGGAVAVTGQLQMANGTNGLTVQSGGAVTVGGQLAMLSGASNLTVQSGGTVTSTGAVFVGALSGNSAVTVTGTGSTFTTPNVISAGGSGGTAGTGTATLTIDNGGSITATVGMFVYSNATVNVNAGGSLSLGGVADGSATVLGGTFNVASGRTLAITDGGGGVFSGVIAGAGGVSKSGAGTQTFAGANTYSGGTTITGGTLSANNTAALGTGSIAVGTGATLGGTVTIPVPAGKTLSGTGTVSAPLSVSGTLTPGGAPATGPGVLTAGANVTFATGSTFAVALNGNTPGSGANNHGQLVLSGTAPTLTLGDATLSATLGYTPANTDRLFVIVINDTAGTVSGTFGNAPGGQVTIGGFLASVSYAGDSASNALSGGNDVVLYNFVPVPEPSHVLLLCAAAGGLVFRWRRARSAASSAPVG